MSDKDEPGATTPFLGLSGPPSTWPKNAAARARVVRPPKTSRSTPMGLIDTSPANDRSSDKYQSLVSLLDLDTNPFFTKGQGKALSGPTAGPATAADDADDAVGSTTPPPPPATKLPEAPPVFDASKAEQAEWATLEGGGDGVTDSAVRAPDPGGTGNIAPGLAVNATAATAATAAHVARADARPGGGSGSTSIAVKWQEPEFLAPAGVKVPKTDNFVDEDSDADSDADVDVINTDGAIKDAISEAAAAALDESLQLDSPADLALAAAMGGMGDMPDAAESAAAAGGLTGDVENDALLPHACLVPGMLGTPSCQDALLREFMADLEDEAMGGDSKSSADPIPEPVDATVSKMRESAADDEIKPVSPPIYGGGGGGGGGNNGVHSFRPEDIPVAGTELYPGEADDAEVPSPGKAPRHLTLDFTDGPASAVASTAATAPGEGPAPPPAPGSGTGAAAAAALAPAALGDAVQAFEIDPDFDYDAVELTKPDRPRAPPGMPARP